VNDFISKCTGIIHVGAHIGQEAELYDSFDKPVVWIEAIPEIFERLKKNILPYKKQKAINALVSEKDKTTCNFHVSSHDGVSSSIFDLGYHKLIRPEVYIVGTMLLYCFTLPTIIEMNSIDLSAYDAIVIDVQGAELLVLKGSIPILKRFKFIKVEVANFESYKEGCVLRDISSFMDLNEFDEFDRCLHGERITGMDYFDVTYCRIKK